MNESISCNLPLDNGCIQTCKISSIHRIRSSTEKVDNIEQYESLVAINYTADHKHAKNDWCPFNLHGALICTISENINLNRCSCHSFCNRMFLYPYADQQHSA